MTDTVSIVIVSHSPDVARGTADMVRQMVGEEVRVAPCGGNPGWRARHRRRRDPGGDRERLVAEGGGDPGRSRRRRDQQRDGDRDAGAGAAGRSVVICNAPVVEGAVMAATEAAGGSDLAAVRQTAEDFQS